MSLNYLQGVPSDEVALGRIVKSANRFGPPLIPSSGFRATKISDSINGYGQDLGFGWKDISIKNAEKFRKKQNEAIKGALKKVSIANIKKVVVGFSLAPVRHSFLLLVVINALGLAGKLAVAWGKDKQRIINWWTKLGGDVDTLKKAIHTGYKSAVLNGIQENEDGSLGVVPAIAVPLAVALPAVLSVVKIFADMKVTKQKEQEEERLALENTKANIKNDPNFKKTIANMPEGEDTGRVEGGSSDGKIFGLPKMVVIGSGVVIVGGIAYMMMKKK
jgi:hypothetical protein